jgi:hypothetical protein
MEKYISYKLLTTPANRSPLHEKLQHVENEYNPGVKPDIY